MSVYTVCAEFIDECCSDEYYALNVLFEFIKDNDKRIAVDRAERRVLKIYGDICKGRRSQPVGVGSSRLRRTENRNIELVTANLAERSGTEIFLEVARRAPKPRKFIVWSLDHYPDIEEHRDIVCLDREAAKRDILPSDARIGRHVEEVSVTKYEINAGHGSNIIIGSKLRDSIKHLSTHVSGEAAKTLKSVADCVEASGSQEAGETFDKLAEELGKEKKSKSKVSSYVKSLFAAIPDMVKIGKSIQETVDVSMGNT